MRLEIKKRVWVEKRAISFSWEERNRILWEANMSRICGTKKEERKKLHIELSAEVFRFPKVFGWALIFLYVRRKYFKTEIRIFKLLFFLKWQQRLLLSVKLVMIPVYPFSVSVSLSLCLSVSPSSNFYFIDSWTQFNFGSWEVCLREEWRMPILLKLMDLLI